MPSKAEGKLLFREILLPFLDLVHGTRIFRADLITDVQDSETWAPSGRQELKKSCTAATILLNPSPWCDLLVGTEKVVNIVSKYRLPIRN